MIYRTYLMLNASALQLFQDYRILHTMGCIHHPKTAKQTFGLLFLSFFMLFFNTSTAYGKGNNLKSKKHSSFAFGRKGRMDANTKTITSPSAFKDLFQQDWAAYALKTVVIDPGHGGRDEGTSSKDGVLEKNVALSISKLLGGYINTHYPSVKVVYTRNKDVFISLKRRAKIANANKADLFISIHCNSFSKAWVRGMEAYVLGLHKADENMEVMMRENNVVQLEDNYKTEYEEYGVDRSSPLYDILMNSYQNAHLDQSLLYSSTLVKQFKNKKLRTRGVRQAGFVVLRRTTMPSVLIETGYLTNPIDKDLLASKKGQKKIAKELFIAFEDYKSKVDNHEKEKSPKKPLSIKTAIKETKTPTNTATPDDFNQGLQFAIQVASSAKILDTSTPKWEEIKNNLYIQKTSAGNMRYIVKGFGKDLEKTAQKRLELADMGFNDCFIVAYHNGKKVSLSWAKAQLK